MTESIALAKSGDQAAMESIVESHREQIRRICRSYFLVNADSEDIMQEAMIGLIQAINSYDSSKNDSFEAYLNMVVNRRLMTIIRNSNRQKLSLQNNALSINPEGAISYDTDETPYNIVAIDDSNIESDLAKREQQSQSIKRIKSLLSDTDYKILTMYLTGYKYAEISSVISESNKYIDNRLMSIKKKINNSKMTKGE